MVVVDQFDRPVVVCVVTREEGIAPNGGAVVPGRPFGALHNDRHPRRHERKAAGVVPMQVREHDFRDRRQVDLVRDALLLLQSKEPENLKGRL